jgi:hypothetical protein
MFFIRYNIINILQFSNMIVEKPKSKLIILKNTNNSMKRIKEDLSKSEIRTQLTELLRKSATIAESFKIKANSYSTEELKQIYQTLIPYSNTTLKPGIQSILTELTYLHSKRQANKPTAPIKKLDTDHQKNLEANHEALSYGKSTKYSVEEFASAVCQVANYDQLLGTTYDEMNFAQIQASFQWRDLKTGLKYQLNDDSAPHKFKELELDESKLESLIDLNDEQLEQFKYSNAKFFIHELFQQSFVYHLDKSKFNREYFQYQNELTKGERVEKFIAELPTLSKSEDLDKIKLSIKAPVGSASDAFLKADLINLVIPDSSDKIASQTVVSAIQKLARAVSVKYSYTGFNPISYSSDIMNKQEFYATKQPPQNQQIDFLISQAAAIQDSIHERIEEMVSQILEDLPHYDNWSDIQKNPSLIAPQDLHNYISEDLVRLILIEDIIQNQIFNLTKTILDDQNVGFSLQGIQIKSSAKGMEKHIHKHGDKIGVIRPPVDMLRSNFSTTNRDYNEDLDQVLQAYTAIHDLD